MNFHHGIKYRITSGPFKNAVGYIADSDRLTPDNDGDLIITIDAHNDWHYIHHTRLEEATKFPIGVELISPSQRARFFLTPDGLPDLYRNDTENASWVVSDQRDNREFFEGRYADMIRVSDYVEPRVFQNLWNIPQDVKVRDRDGDMWEFSDGDWYITYHRSGNRVRWTERYAPRSTPFTEITA
ncbi:hypothetical protein GS454_04705 [Rhodococcus hoagii]|nr:hypothetical protein [Prescottella equi]